MARDYDHPNPRGNLWTHCAEELAQTAAEAVANDRIPNPARGDEPDACRALAVDEHAENQIAPSGGSPLALEARKLRSLREPGRLRKAQARRRR